MNVKDEIMLKEKIVELCVLDLDKEQIFTILEGENVSLREELGFDSLMMVELIVELESLFDIEFDMNDLNIGVLQYYDGLKKYLCKDNM